MEKSEASKEVVRLITEAENNLGVTSHKLASMLGVAAPRVYEWKKGISVPSSSVLFDLANLTGKPITFK